MRIATFNIENLDTASTTSKPTLEQRKPTLQATLKRLNADILCLQEVHGQETPAHTSNNPDRVLSALDYIVEGSQYQGYHRVSTLTSDGTPYNQRNLVILSRFPIADHQQYRNTLIKNLQYRKVMAIPEEAEADDIGWERPILHAQLTLPDSSTLHVINLHLKSRLASNINGQKVNSYTWRSASGWAEGYFLSSIKRVGQALETRVLIDQLLEQDPAARIVVCGDFNAEPGEVPVEAIQGGVNNTNNPALRASTLVACSRAIPESVRFSHLHHGQGNLLDHMLISQSLLPYFEEASLHNENLNDESLPYTDDRKYPESDHAAFVSQFAGSILDP